MPADASDISSAGEGSDDSWEDEDSNLPSDSDVESSDDIDDEEDLDRADALNGNAPTAEGGIEGNFDRLVRSIRTTEGTTSGGMLNKLWDFNIEDQDAEFKDDLRAASGIGKTKRTRGRRIGPVLSQQVKALIGEGNQAFIDGNTEETIRIMQEVIRIEPRASSAWSVLAQCYESMNQPQKALQLRIMAAHLMHDADIWNDLAQQSRSLGFNQQALYCYSKVYALDPSNVGALGERAFLAKEVGELRTARQSLLAMLKILPHDLAVLSELRPILIDLSDLSTCASLFQSAFDHYQTLFPAGPPPIDPSVSAPTFGLMEIYVLADLYNTNTLAMYEKAVRVVRQGVRWLQGRGEQKWWDSAEDDREYDLPPEAGTSSLERVREGDVRPGFYPLDVNARHRLAVARIKMGDVEEGKIHANIVLLQDVVDYAPLFAEIADAYFEREMYAEARPVYEILGGDAGTSSLYILLQVATCRRMLGEMKEAAEVYEYVIAADPSHNDAKMRLAEVYEILNEPRKALNLVYQVVDSRRKRGALKEPGMEQISASASGSTSLFEEKSRKKGKAKEAKVSNRPTLAELRQLEEEKEREVTRGYNRVKELWPRMAQGDDEAEREWLLEAEKLTETFRVTRKLFVTGKNNPFRGMLPIRRGGRTRKASQEAEENDMVTRLQLDLEGDKLRQKVTSATGPVDVFRGVSFDDWLRLFMQYAFLLTKSDQYDLADEILRHVSFSNAYLDRSKQDTIRLTLIACAIAAKRQDIVVEQSRRLIHAYQFNNEPYRILTAALASGLRQTDSFITSALGKHMNREVKIADAILKVKEPLKWNAVQKRWTIPGGIGRTSKDEDDDEVPDDVEDAAVPEDSGSAKPDANAPRRPTKPNPILVTIYGQICLAAKSYQSALFYLLHAYSYCPNDPIMCLSLAIASLGRAMQRQADNRHHLVAQALALLSQYRTLRVDTDSHAVDEVEFNFGRAMQQLGLHSHAARHYERVLQLTEERLKSNSEDFGVAREAAYNLSLIYVATGAGPLAEALYRRWLSL